MRLICGNDNTVEKVNRNKRYTIHIKVTERGIIFDKCIFEKGLSTNSYIITNNCKYGPE